MSTSIVQFIQSLISGVGAQATGTIQINGMPPMPFPGGRAAVPEGAAIVATFLQSKAGNLTGKLRG